MRIPIYHLSPEKPSPLEDMFDLGSFERLFSEPGVEKLSAKAFLATEQRIRGLGNGVLQDILYHARINPRLRIGALGSYRRNQLFWAMMETLRRMADLGGRDSEFDLHGRPGGYLTIMCRKSVGKSCPSCGSSIVKAAYLGGSTYFCPECQPG